MKKTLLNAVDFTAFFYAIGQLDFENVLSIVFMLYQTVNMFVKMICAIVNFVKNKNKSELDEKVSQIGNDIINQIIKGDYKNGKNS